MIILQNDLNLLLIFYFLFDFIGSFFLEYFKFATISKDLLAVLML
jgi:hypothetical protein